MRTIFAYLKRTFALKKRKGTVRFMFPAALTFAALAATVISSDVSYVRLQTTDSVIEAGQSFSIDVYAHAHVPVNAVDITLEFDPDVVEVTGVDVGQSVITIWAQEPLIENNTVLLQGGTYRKGFVDEHKIATVNLRANEIGKSSIQVTGVSLLAGDGLGSEVTVAESTGSIVNLYIFDESTDPADIDVNVEVKLVTDIDGDGDVTLKDISAFMGSWHNKDKIHDFNGDGRMTFRDFSIILASIIF